jgi:hypothetical protein
MVAETALGLPPQEDENIVSGPLNGLRVIFQAADEAGCGGYRCILPVGQMRKLGAKAKWTRRITSLDFGQYDVFVYQRPFDPSVVDELQELSRAGKLTLVESDDNLHKVDPNSPVFEAYKNPVTYTKCCKIADGMIVSTPELAEHYYKYNQNIVVAYNNIDLSLGYRDWSGTKTEIERKPGEVIIGWRGGSCYDDQTEILTEKRGFQLFRNLTKEDKVATLNPKSGELEYNLPSSYTDVEFKGKLHTVENMHVDFAVTPNHWMYVSGKGKKNDSDYYLVQAENIWNRPFHVKKNAKWTGEDLETFTIPNGPTINARDWFKFFGFWLAEGWTDRCINDSGNPSNRIGLAQYKDKGILIEMAQMIESWGFNITWSHKNGQIVFTDKAICDYLSQFGKAPDKYIPVEMKKASKHLLQTLLEYYLIGDGSSELAEGRKTPRLRGYTVSKSLADDLVELSIKIGWSANLTNRGKRNGQLKDREIVAKHDAYQINFLRDDGTQNYLKPLVTKEHQKLVDYDGRVYCVTVENHLLFVRRNGKTIIAQNTHQEDLWQIRNVMNKVMHKYENVRLALYSNVMLSEWAIRAWGLEDIADRVTVLQPRNFCQFPEGLSDMDVIIVPLKYSEFNAGKSELALCEAGAIGIPGVASPSAPYRRFANVNKDYPIGQYALIPRTDDEWIESLGKLVTDESYRSHMSKMAFNRVYEDYNLETGVYHWAKGFMNLAERKMAGIKGPGTAEKVVASRNDKCPICIKEGVDNPPKFKKCLSHRDYLGAGGVRY